MPTAKAKKTPWSELSRAAWAARRNAHLIASGGKVAVGAALITRSGRVFSGCNVEHIFRCHDVHAEVNAISSMAAAGERRIKAILVAAAQTRFTPCGSCMDWIMQFGGPKCLVAYQTSPRSTPRILRAEQLMPHYPYL